MKLTVTPEAVRCFIEEWGYKEGDQVRIFSRLNGAGGEAFPLGVMRDEPRYPVVTFASNGITFFIEETNVWSLEGKDLRIDCRNNEIVFIRE